MNLIIKIYIWVLFISYIVVLYIFFNHQILLSAGEIKYNNYNINDSRGTIFFTNKDGDDIPVALSTTKYNLTVNPSIIEDENELYEHINSIVNIDKDNFYEKIKDKNRIYALIKKDIDREIYEKLKERTKIFKLKGLTFNEDADRKYPFDTLASHLIGFYGGSSDSKKFSGRYGLEKQYESYLSGKIGNNKNIYTTIDIEIQKYLEHILWNIQDKWNSKQSMGIISNPNTGEIYAMAVNPSFNLNEFNKVEDNAIFNNHIVEGRYELGSIFKLLTVAIGLQSEKVERDFTYFDEGKIEVSGITINNYDKEGRGEDTTLQTIIEESLNTGAVTVLQETGIDTYKNYLSTYRFDDKTEINLPNEIFGKTNLKSNVEVDIVTMSYGHGLAVTPISALKAFSSIPNGGKIIEPRVVKNNIYENKREEIQIYSKETVDLVTEYMVNSFDNVLLGGVLKNKNYSLAGKTGTALLLNERGEYEEERSLHSYVGFFPASNPEFLVLLITIDPKEVKYSSSTLAEPFVSISNFILDYYSVPPDR